MKKALSLFLCAILLLSLTACGGTKSKEPADLTGQWKQSNSGSKDSYMTATISGDTIEIYWTSETDDSKSLYWDGTFTAPTTADEPSVWTSENAPSQTDTALLASMDDTKEFTYQKGVISYSASALGTTTTVKLEKVK